MELDRDINEIFNMASAGSNLITTRSIHSGLVIVVIGVLTFTDLTYGKTCKRTNNCACKFDDGSGVIDISSVGSKSGGPK